MAEDHRADHQRLSSSEENLNLPEKQVMPGFAPQPALQRAPRRWNDIWEKLLRLGLGEIALRTGTVLASIALVLLVLWVMGSFYLQGNVVYEGDLAYAAAEPTATATVRAPEFKIKTSGVQNGGIT